MRVDVSKFKLGRFPAGLIAARQEIYCSQMNFIIHMREQVGEDAKMLNELCFPLRVNSMTWFLNDLLTHSFIHQTLVNNKGHGKQLC